MKLARKGNGQRKTYRITFYESFEMRIDPYLFALIACRNHVKVVGRDDVKPQITVTARQEDLFTWTHDLNRHSGPLAFKHIEELGEDGYQRIT